MGDDAPIFTTVSSGSREYTDHGIQLCQDLVYSIRDEYLDWLGGKRNCALGLKAWKSRAGDFIKEMKLEEFDPTFNFKRKFIGSKGRHMRYIEDKSRSIVEIDQSDDDAPIFITVSSGKREYTDHGIQLCQDLVYSIRDDYLDWLGGKRHCLLGLKAWKRRDGDFIKEMKLEKFDPAFNFKKKFLGSKGRTIRHIEDKSRSIVEIDQSDDDAPIFITVSSGT